MSIYKWLRDWAKAKYRDEYLRKCGVNLNCPHCNTWTSDSDSESWFQSCGNHIAVQYNCGQCLKRSHWVCEAGFWFQAERFGITIKQEATNDQSND